MVTPLHRHGSRSDLMSNTHSQSGSMSQTLSIRSIRSSASNRHRHSAKAKSTDPTTLSYYRGTEAHDILVRAKDNFVVGTFSSGYFFHHKRSLYLDIFLSRARDALSVASWDQFRRCFYLNYSYHCADATVFRSNPKR